MTVPRTRPIAAHTELSTRESSDRGWRSRAACLAEDPELFFPIGVTGPSVIQEAQAKAVCAGCPVRATCLEWAAEINVSDGIWGGLTADEIRNLKRRRTRGSQSRRRSDAGTTPWSGIERKEAR